MRGGQRGAAYCWGGDGALGSLGNGSSDPSGSAAPVAVDTAGVLAGKALIQIADGQGFTCAVDTGGAAYCWEADFGDLGDGSTTTITRPPVIATLIQYR